MLNSVSTIALSTRNSAKAGKHTPFPWQACNAFAGQYSQPTFFGLLTKEFSMSDVIKSALASLIQVNARPRFHSCMLSRIMNGDVNPDGRVPDCVANAR